MPTQPASRVEQFPVTIPPNTPIAAPVEIATGFPPGEVTAVRIRVPGGHVFRTGMRLLLAHAQAIPTTAGAWLSGDNDSYEPDLIGQPNSGAWSVQGYNTDLIAHTFYVTFFVLDTIYLSPQSDEAPIATPLIA